MIDFKGKKGVVLGVGNSRSIAWAITESLHQCGAELALTFIEDPKGRYEKNVRSLGTQVEASIIHPCDVQDEKAIDSLMEVISQQWGKLDFLVHSLAFAKQEDLGGSFSETSRDGFLKAQEISAYSLLPLSAGAAPLMRKNGGGSIITMSYIGAMLAVPNYNAMGPAKAALESSVRYLARELGTDNIRVNAISAGPIRTLSASGVKNFSTLIQGVAEQSALKRNVTQAEVGATAAFLCSDAASAITGQTIYVDCGFNVMGGA
ncbi:MAG: SDR family oxidoreductase [SAR324 cluster bacterium]|nr:SDR family oxidoreductase [SAR324 cluster bacterium]